MNRWIGWRLRGQSGVVILTKITAGIEVPVVVLTDNDGGLRSHNVAEFSRGQQIVLLKKITARGVTAMQTELEKLFRRIEMFLFPQKSFLSNSSSNRDGRFR